MKDLFTGSLGHLDNHGGSPMFTTPNTIYVPPEYEIETDVPSVAEFVTCTLDGRLWVWKRSRRYYVSAFRWNEETERLEFVSTTILNGETVQKRGVDWILTDKSFLQSQVEAPYISRTEYDSDDTTYSDAIEKCYSFWPELETWQEIQSGIKLTNIPSVGWEDISQKFIAQNIITPLEIHYYSDDNIQIFTDFIPKIYYCNGQLYAKGKAHIGRAYLLPRINRRGNFRAFYLYISPDYLRNYDIINHTFNDNDNWNDFIIEQLNEKSLCRFIPENHDNAYCKRPKNGQVFLLPQNEQLNLNVNNEDIFFDNITHSNLMLNGNKVSFLNNDLSYEAEGLYQWVTPSKNFDFISGQITMSSFDNGTLITHYQEELHRELVNKKILSITAEDYLGKRLSLGLVDKAQKKLIQINSINDFLENNLNAIWEKIYKGYLNIEITRFFNPNPDHAVSSEEIKNAKENLIEWYLPNETNKWTNIGQGVIFDGVWYFTDEAYPNVSWYPRFREPIVNLLYLAALPSGYYWVDADYYNHSAYVGTFCRNFYPYTYFDKESLLNGIYTRALHFCCNDNHSISVFKSELHPEIFDFQAELERSKLT